ncbi:MAG: phenylacetate--CoA ligase, partial [Gammaproteobacteria bacterium]|nr:phenylacetate--CoA ligase [Gammaproteobacteria bacterium]
WEDHFYPEVIDPETGAPQADDDFGELVFTSLTKEALPIIRYRTRDLTRLLPGSARTMRRMGKITGRSDDMFIIRGVNVFPTQIEEQILKLPELAPHYQIEISREGNLDQVLINVEAAPDAQGADRDLIAYRLTGNIKDVVGISTRIVVHNEGVVPRSEGKATRVLDRRKG